MRGMARRHDAARIVWLVVLLPWVRDCHVFLQPFDCEQEVLADLPVRAALNIKSAAYWTLGLPVTYET